MKVEVLKDDTKVIKILKGKLNKNDGKAIVKLFKGDECDIRYAEDGQGIASSKIPSEDNMRWEVFNAVIELLENNNGQAKKGNARSGRLGNPQFTIDTVEGYIAYKAYGKEEGESSFGPGFVIYAILEWCEICENNKGYLKLKREWQ